MKKLLSAITIATTLAFSASAQEQPVRIQPVPSEIPPELAAAGVCTLLAYALAAATTATGVGVGAGVALWTNCWIAADEINYRTGGREAYE